MSEGLEGGAEGVHFYKMMARGGSRGSDEEMN